MNKIKSYKNVQSHLFVIGYKETIQASFFKHKTDPDYLANIMELLSSDSFYAQSYNNYKSFCDGILRDNETDYYDASFLLISIDKIIGFLNFKIIDKVCEIDFFCVGKEYRKSGYGQKLFDSFLSYLSSEAKVKKIILEVSEKNLSAIRFYEKQKFNIFSKRQNYYKDGSHACIMQRILS